jgi:hypothetical protein
MHRLSRRSETLRSMKRGTCLFCMILAVNNDRFHKLHYQTVVCNGNRFYLSCSNLVFFFSHSLRLTVFLQVLIHFNNIHSALLRYTLSVNIAVAFFLPPVKF